MMVLGEVRLDGRATGLPRFRRRVLELLVALRWEHTDAALVAMAVAEVSHRLRAMGDAPVLRVGIDGETFRVEACSSHAGDPRVAAAAQSFFDHVAHVDDALVLQRLPPRGSARATEALVAAQRAAFAQRSREELMQELADKNLALRRHGEQLEREVAARTRELADETEALQVARVAADRANRAKSEFLSNMSHELRTPLNGVLGYAQILQRDAALTRDHHRSLEAIEHCGQHLLTLINNVLDLSKIEAGHMEVDRRACDLQRLLRAVHDIVAPRAHAKGLTLRLDVDETLPRGFETDPTRLRQVLVNLCGNAVKFTERGVVRIEARRAGGGHLEFAVHDTGIGIPRDRWETVFEPFRQDEGGAREGGTGLGLTISRQLVEMLGGSISVESEPGVGSTFRVLHPLVEADGVAGDDAAAAAARVLHDPKLAPGQTVTVMVADDQPANRDVLDQILTRAGFEVVQARDGAEALALLRTRPFQLALLDIRMPTMSGEALIGEIRRDPALCDIVAIAVTASVFAESAERFRALGFQDLVGKPFEIPEIFQKIERHTGLVFEACADAPTQFAHEAPLPSAGRGLDAARANEIATSLREACDTGDVMAVSAIADALRAEGDVAQSMLDRLDELASNFDFSGIVALADELTTAPP